MYLMFTIVKEASAVQKYENSSTITKALNKIKELNPNWKPKYFMVDHCEAEIKAIITCFPAPDCQPFICDFHREQAWSRWLKAIQHGLKQYIEDVLLIIRRVARAQTTAHFDEAISNLKESYFWITHIGRIIPDSTWSPDGVLREPEKAKCDDVNIVYSEDNVNISRSSETEVKSDLNQCRDVSNEEEWERPKPGAKKSKADRVKSKMQSLRMQKSRAVQKLKKKLKKLVED
ncbi:unnamed protein product [Mytilus coruscus]|uniref:Uncharacterized protein n=1 Tax=Mytilus coruscus TaxID=42192 RepID=A0A6J8DET6_MYTCO|nr:unnamed protein product [Mytilus coruscus]